VVGGVDGGVHTLGGFRERDVTLHTTSADAVDITGLGAAVPRVVRPVGGAHVQLVAARTTHIVTYGRNVPSGRAEASCSSSAWPTWRRKPGSGRLSGIMQFRSMGERDLGDFDVNIDVKVPKI
jgi:hypothetical protein